MKPPVFNHKQYTDLEADYMILKAENERLKSELAATKRLLDRAVEEMCHQCKLDYVERDKPMRCDECEWRGAKGGTE